MLLSSKVDPAVYKEDLTQTDYFPYTRPLFSDGFNSLAHFLLGVATPQYPLILPVFAAYQAYQYHPYGNTLTDVEEYGLGILGGSLMNKSVNKELPNIFKYELL